MDKHGLKTKTNNLFHLSNGYMPHKHLLLINRRVWVLQLWFNIQVNRVSRVYRCLSWSFNFYCIYRHLLLSYVHVRNPSVIKWWHFKAIDSNVSYQRIHESTRCSLANTIHKYPVINSQSLRNNFSLQLISFESASFAIWCRLEFSKPRMIVVILFLGVATAIYVYMKWCFSYWSRRNVPSPEPSFLVGNIGPTLIFRRHMGNIIEDWYTWVAPPSTSKLNGQVQTNKNRFIWILS